MEAIKNCRKILEKTRINKLKIFPEYVTIFLLKYKEEIKNYEKDDDNTIYDWAIELKEIGEPIGSISAVSINYDIESVQIGYCIGFKWWHKGIVSEAFKEVIRFFMEDVGVNRIEARCDSRNVNSSRVMEKCGLTYEGTLRSSDKNNAGVCNILWYSILKSDYYRR